jgi:hypothetical protein
MPLMTPILMPNMREPSSPLTSGTLVPSRDDASLRPSRLMSASKSMLSMSEKQLAAFASTKR